MCLCTHQGATEGPGEWFLGGDGKFQAWLPSISEALLSPGCTQCPASQWRCSETQHTKWDVTCAAILFYLYWMGRCWGRNATKHKKALTCCLMRSGGSPSPVERLCNFHLHIWGCKGDLTLLNHLPRPASPTSPPQRQRQTVDNYLVWNFLRSQCLWVSQNSYFTAVLRTCKEPIELMLVLEVFSQR